jgi:spore coat protein U-like protein
MLFSRNRASHRFIDFDTETSQMTCLHRMPVSGGARRTGGGIPFDRDDFYSASRRHKRFGLGSAGLLGILLLSLPLTPGVAATATNTFAVTATVQATCLVTATTVAFGTYTGVVVTATGTLSITCTNTTPYSVALSAGLGVTPTATVTTRHMTGPGVGLNYGLFRDGAWTLNWGLTPGTDTAAGTGNGNVQTLTVYGQLPAGQYIAPGAYTDTITATINY